MRLLVTGGAGFIGANFIRQIIDEPIVDGLLNLDALTYAGHSDNLGPVNQHPKYRFIQLDLRQQAEINAVCAEFLPTHVVHLAAESHVDRSILDPSHFVQTNVLGTYNLLEACRLSQTRGEFQRFLQVSTDEVYGSLGATGLFTEATPLQPNSPYSASKAAADHLVRAYLQTYGFPTVITRCSNNYGPFQFPEKLIPVVIRSLLDREPIPLYGDGLQRREWLFVADHVRALWQVLTQGELGSVYNIGTGADVTNRELVELICDRWDQRFPNQGKSSRQLIRSIQDRPGHDRRYAMDASKVRRELAWEPRVSLEAGVAETISWYVANQNWLEVRRAQMPHLRAAGAR